MGPERFSIYMPTLQEVATPEITLKVEKVDNYFGTWTSVDKKCTKCNLLVFIPKGKDEENCIKIVNDRFDSLHTNCDASSADEKFGGI